MKVISISGTIGVDVLAPDVRKQIDGAFGDDLRIELASPGGFVFDGLEIYNLIRNYRGRTTVHLMGLAASMASYIAMAGQRVTAEANVVFMIHNPWGLAVGDHNDMEKEAQVLRGLAGTLATAYAQKSGKSDAEIRQLMDDETFYFGREALDAGFIDEVLGIPSGDKAAALRGAHASLDAALAKMREQGRQRNDLEKVAALVRDTPRAEKPFSVDPYDIKRRMDLQRAKQVVGEERLGKMCASLNMTCDEFFKESGETWESLANEIQTRGKGY